MNNICETSYGWKDLHIIPNLDKRVYFEGHWEPGSRGRLKTRGEAKTQVESVVPVMLKTSCKGCSRLPSSMRESGGPTVVFVIITILHPGIKSTLTLSMYPRFRKFSPGKNSCERVRAGGNARDAGRFSRERLEAPRTGSSRIESARVT